MAAGLPAVMTDGTGLAGFLEPGRDAVVVPAADAPALAEAIAGLLLDADRAAAVGRAGRAAVARFHADRVATDLAAILDELVPVPAPTDR
jgi:glycosyltransferase involved in cell wall biosynthesis